MPAGLKKNVLGSSAEAATPAKEVAMALGLWSLSENAPARAERTPPASSSAPATADAPPTRRKKREGRGDIGRGEREVEVIERARKRTAGRREGKFPGGGKSAKGKML